MLDHLYLGYADLIERDVTNTREIYAIVEADGDFQAVIGHVAVNFGCSVAS